MYVRREIQEKFSKITKIYSVIALIGARQAGKTTFLKKNMKEAAYVLFDDPDAKDLFEEDIKKFETQFLKKLSVLDEVHYCKGAGPKIKYLADTGRKLWITSSSEILLQKEILSYLVGRISIIRLYPFSIKEFFESKKIKSTNEKILKRTIWEHMMYGGYPKVVTTNDKEMKKTILKDLYETMILKDIAQTFSIEDIDSLQKFSKYLAINTTSLITYNKISDITKLSHQSIKKYLGAMEKSHLIKKIQPFFKNKTKEITKQPKIYFVDNGLRNAIIKTFNTEITGELFENYVFSELLKKDLEIKFWRTKTKAEVDFIIEKENEIIPIEVKLQSTKITQSLQTFIKKYKPKKCYVITYEGKKRKTKFENTEIEFLDLVSCLEKIS